MKRKAALTVVDDICDCAGRAGWRRSCRSRRRRRGWRYRPARKARCIWRAFPKIPRDWRDENLAAKWDRVQRSAPVVTGALEIERADKKIGSQLEAAPDVYVTDPRADGCFRTALAARTTSIWRRCASRQRLRRSSTSAHPKAPSRCPNVPGVGVVREAAPRARSARAPGALPRTSAPIPPTRTCPRAMPPPCARSTAQGGRMTTETSESSSSWLWGPMVAAGAHGRPGDLRARSGAQVVDALRLRHRRARGRVT